MSRVSLKNTFLDFKDENEEASSCRRQRSRSQDCSPASFELRRSQSEAAEREQSPLLARYTEVLKNPTSPYLNASLGPKRSRGDSLDTSPSRIDHHLGSEDYGSEDTFTSWDSGGYQNGKTCDYYTTEELVAAQNGNGCEFDMNIEENEDKPISPHRRCPSSGNIAGLNSGPSTSLASALRSISSCPAMSSLVEEEIESDGEYPRQEGVNGRRASHSSPYQAPPPSAGPYAPQYAPVVHPQRGRQPAEDDYMRTREDAPSPEALRIQRHNSGNGAMGGSVGKRNSRAQPQNPQNAGVPQNPQPQATAGPGCIASSTPGQYRHNHVPKSKNLEKEYDTGGGVPITTLMIRNIPNRYSQRDLIEEMDELGFGGTYDFLYLPMDKGTLSNVGYAFVNFVDAQWGERGMEAFKSYRFKRYRKQSGKIATVSVAHIQGLENNLKHYQHTAVKDAREKQHRPMVIPSIQRALSGTVPSFEGCIDDL